MEKLTGVKSDTSVFKIVGCRAFAHIDKLQRRKNHDAKAFQFFLWDRLRLRGIHYTSQKNMMYTSLFMLSLLKIRGMIVPIRNNMLLIWFQ